MPVRLAIAAALLLLLAPLAFWPSYLSKLDAAGSHRHVHAALGTLWLLLLIVQPLLIRSGHRRPHRWLGRVAVALGAAFAASGVVLARRGLVAMSEEQFARDGHLVYLPLAMAAIFGAALALAVRWRASSPVHARFMAATALPLLDPLSARLLYNHAPSLPFDRMYQVPAFAVIMLALAGMLRSVPATAPGRGSLRVFAWAVAIALLGYYVVPDTGPWQQLVGWLRP